MKQDKPNRLLIIATATLSLAALLAAGCGPAGESSAKANPYPLKTCAVSGEELGSMGDPITKVYQGQEVKFCCKDCIKEFESAPEKYLAKLKTPEMPKAPEAPNAPALPTDK